MCVTFVSNATPSINLVLRTVHDGIHLTSPTVVWQ